MKKKISSIITMTFFAAVIIVSVVVMMNNNDGNSVETINTIPEEYRIETDAIPEYESVSETTRFYGHDIDFETAPTETMLSETIASLDETTVPESAVDTYVTTSRTIITSRQRKEYDSNAVYLDMENILQQPELPVGCEITALTILLRHYGFDAEKTDMARNYLPISWGNSQTIDGKVYKDSFFDYFIGDPFSRGYGCFSPAIEKAANKYISEHGGGFTVKNISGCHPDTLYEYLIAGTPVLCWATDGMIEPEYYETWYDNATGNQLDWYLNEHCFVLAGFNIANSTVTLNDPMKGIIDYNIDKFEVRFKQMHSQAIVILPDGTSEIEETTTTSAPEETIIESETAAMTEASSETTAVSETETYSETFSETTAEYSEYSSESEYVDIDTDFFTGSFIYD